MHVLTRTPLVTLRVSQRVVNLVFSNRNVHPSKSRNGQGMSLTRKDLAVHVSLSSSSHCQRTDPNSKGVNVKIITLNQTHRELSPDKPADQSLPNSGNTKQTNQIIRSVLRVIRLPKQPVNHKI